MNLTCWDEGNPDSWTVIGLLTEIQVARWLFRASQVMDRHSTTMEVDGTVMPYVLPLFHRWSLNLFPLIL